jgi:hypothetical protein
MAEKGCGAVSSGARGEALFVSAADDVSRSALTKQWISDLRGGNALSSKLVRDCCGAAAGWNPG